MVLPDYLLNYPYQPVTQNYPYHPLHKIAHIDLLHETNISVTLGGFQPQNHFLNVDIFTFLYYCVLMLVVITLHFVHLHSSGPLLELLFISVSRSTNSLSLITFLRQVRHPIYHHPSSSCMAMIVPIIIEGIPYESSIQSGQQKHTQDCVNMWEMICN